MYTRKANRSLTCTGKRGYKSPEVAYRIRRNLIEQGASSEVVVAYQCRFCREWHVGHKPTYRGQANHKNRRRH
jgi:hypothetical protein